MSGLVSSEEPVEPPIYLEQVVGLLARVLELGRPGAGERGLRLADAALRLAARFEVPEKFLPDLALAARLHEIGLVVDGTPRHEAGAGDRHWRHTVSGTTILRSVPALHGVASLVEAIRENWDGSGFPNHHKLGQIPFRSRILRVMIDFYAELERSADGGAPIDGVAAVQRLAERAGTCYDPVIVTALAAIVGAGPELAAAAGRVVLPVSELHEGMVLAEDLCTSGGAKLLARGATLSHRSLDLIRQRHQTDPILAGAWVERATAG